MPLGEITIQILPPVQTEGVTKDQIDNLIKKTRDPMIEALRSMPTKQDWNHLTVAEVFYDDN